MVSILIWQVHGPLSYSKKGELLERSLSVSM